MKFPILPILLTTIACLATPHARAQGTDRLLSTLGATIENEGRHQAFILWQPGEAGATFGKRFSINRKDGPADSPSSFTRVGIQTLQTSPNTIRAILDLAATIDPSHFSLSSRIDGLYSEAAFRDPALPAAPADASLDAANKLATLIAAAATEPRTLSRLFFLGRAHPSVMMALGHAYQLPVSPGVHTFEIREIDLAENDIRVVGRVTLDTTNPLEISAPSSPVRVQHSVDPDSVYSVSPKDHLNVRFRWGIPNRLREMLPHTFGFDLFRVRQDVAEDLGWHTSAPSPDLILQALQNTPPTDANPAVSKVNDLPILISDILTPAQANDPDDTSRIDIIDDGIRHRDVNGQPIRREFQDGEAFYYFVAAREITGHPGMLSPGTLAVICRAIPPLPPVVEAVDAIFLPPADAAEWAAQGQGGTQFLQVKIRQLPESPAAGAAQGYHIYRWSSPAEYLNSAGNPEIGRIGYVEHIPGETFVTFDDNAPGAPTPETHEDVSVWYTARAVGISACTSDLLSGHSGPTPGFLRDFRAPDAPAGDFQICREIPSSEFDRRFTGKPEDDGLSPDYRGITVKATRASSRIVAADVLVEMRFPDDSRDTLHSRRHMFRHGDEILISLPHPEPPAGGPRLVITVRGVTAHGLVSEPAVTTSPVPGQPPADYALFPFLLDATRDCRDISQVPDARPVHEAFDADGSANPITGFISFPTDQGVSEWRIYRRVGDDGPLTLIAKSEGPSLTSPAPWVDGALPAASGVRVCYYAQVFDQNGNPSPLHLLGCVELLNPDLPTPMLSPAVVSSATEPGRMEVVLDWFCDPVGVERFEILIARDGGDIPAPQNLSPLLAAEALAIGGDDFSEQSFYRFQTARVSGPALGDGPQFSTTLTLPADGVYYFAVAAVGPGNFGARATGSASNIVSAVWFEEADGPQPIIPWPARRLPGSFDARQPIETYTSLEGPLWPVSFPPFLTNATGILVGVTRHPLNTDRLSLSAELASPRPPEEYFFQIRNNRFRSTELEALMPFVLFRHQVPSEIYPDAAANLVQCTPLIDRIAWRTTTDDSEREIFEIRDPYFTFATEFGETPVELPVAGGWSDDAPPVIGPALAANPAPPYLQDATGFIFLNDPLPVAQGAKYRYLIVQFDSRSEIRRVIPVQPIQP